MVGPAALRSHIRIIAPDRPGFGRSEFKPGRKLEDWPEDVIELANALNLGRFAIMGFSGGGPYVAVCALKIPQRLRLLQVGRGAPWLFMLFYLGIVRAMKRNPDRFLAHQLADLPKPDQVALARTEIRESIARAFLEVFRAGSRGAALENALFARSWGFRLQDITKEVYLWHGDLDINVPPAMGHHVTSAIPNCRSRSYAGEGHLSLFVNHTEEILHALSSKADGNSG